MSDGNQAEAIDIANLAAGDEGLSRFFEDTEVVDDRIVLRHLVDTVVMEANTRGVPTSEIMQMFQDSLKSSDPELDQPGL